ncbi:MAG: nucleotidyltransferase family protein [Bacteroidales bacterium]|nr:nucleotidyltransferase family protein [Bacteroidales bacterium]
MNLLKKIHPITIQQDQTLLVALKQMDAIKRKLLIVFSGDEFINILSAGDIQRAIINNLPLTALVSTVLRKNPIIATAEDSMEEIKSAMLRERIEFMPVVDSNREIVDVLFWEQVFGSVEKRLVPKLDLPVVIMAGGLGKRLLPLTNVIPKPLIPIGEKTIVEEIMDRFIDVGCDSFLMSVNYKAETIKQYFDQCNFKYKIVYFQEDKPLGTAGSISLLKKSIKSTFFVSNCDIIINEDYSEILKYHQENGNSMTIVSALKHIYIPYGTIETGHDGIVQSFIEKPELTFQVNSGLYILEPTILDFIPENTFFQMNQLVDIVMTNNGKVGVFPVSEGSWIDIGEWDGYIHLLNKK